MTRVLMKLFFSVLLISCNRTDIERQEESSACLPESTLYLYSSANNNYRVLYENWQKNLDPSSKAFSEDVEFIASTIDHMAATLINQAGGIGPEDYKLVQPCRTGGNPIREVFSQENYTELNDKLVAMRGQYADSKHVEVIDFLEYSIDNYLTGEEAVLNPTYVQNTPYSVLSTELLILELNLLFYTQKSLMDS